MPLFSGILLTGLGNDGRGDLHPPTTEERIQILQHRRRLVPHGIYRPPPPSDGFQTRGMPREATFTDIGHNQILNNTNRHQGSN